MKVNYSESYPEVNYPFKTLDALTQAGILTKAKYWEYEQEYRLFSVRIEDGEAARLGLSWKDDHVAIIEEESVFGITLGARMPEIQKDKITDYCNKKYPRLKIDQAKICAERFNIEIL